MEQLTCYTNTVDVVRNDTFALNDAVQLGTGTMENNGVKTDAVEEGKTEGELVDLVENGTSDLDDGKLGRLVCV